MVKINLNTSKNMREDPLFMRNSYEKYGKYGFSLIKKQNIDLTNISLIACSDTKANDKEKRSAFFRR